MEHTVVFIRQVVIIFYHPSLPFIKFTCIYSYMAKCSFVSHFDSFTIEFECLGVVTGYMTCSWLS